MDDRSRQTHDGGATEPMFGSVLVGVDGRSGGRDAIALAKRLARPGARIVLAAAYGGGGWFGRGAGPVIVDERHEAAEILAGARVDAELEAETVVCYDKTPARALHRMARENGSDLIVVGSSRRSTVGRVLLGDDTLAALQGSPCAVAIAPRGYTVTDRPPRRIAVGVDQSAEGELALRAGRALAAMNRGVVTAISVVALQAVPVEPPMPLDWTRETESAIHQERERLSAVEGVQSRVVYGRPGHELVAASEDFDLMVVGSRGHGPLGSLLSGSVSTYLARHVYCPLLVLPRPLTPGTGEGTGHPAARPAVPTSRS
jgi:nucleotide-binding universal stress UspA family protein